MRERAEGEGKRESIFSCVLFFCFPFLNKEEVEEVIPAW